MSERTHAKRVRAGRRAVLVLVCILACGLVFGGMVRLALWRYTRRLEVTVSRDIGAILQVEPKLCLTNSISPNRIVGKLEFHSDAPGVVAESDGRNVVTAFGEQLFIVHGPESPGPFAVSQDRDLQLYERFPWLFGSVFHDWWHGEAERMTRYDIVWRECSNGRLRQRRFSNPTMEHCRRLGLVLSGAGSVNSWVPAYRCVTNSYGVEGILRLPMDATRDLWLRKDGVEYIMAIRNTVSDRDLYRLVSSCRWLAEAPSHGAARTNPAGTDANKTPRDNLTTD